MQSWLEDIIEQICIAQILRDSKDIISARRLAMIIVDNSVEFMLKAYGDTRLIPAKISKIKWEEKKQSFKKMLDFVAINSALTLDPDDVFHYHDKLRNPLYHTAAPLSVESIKISEYIDKGKIILNDLFGVKLSEKEYDMRIQKVISSLRGKIKSKLVEFFLTTDNYVRIQTNIKLKDTESILLIIFGYSLKKGESPYDTNEVEKSLNYSGHPIEKKQLRVVISQLRKNKKINKGELTLTSKARDEIKTRYIIDNS